MTTKSTESSTENTAQRGTSDAPPKETAQKISPAERWLLVTEKAYARVQQHGFVGGDPFDFWLEAEKEVDAKYDTDFHSTFSQVDALQLTDQVKSVFGGFGLGHLGLDDLLEKHRSGLQMLTDHNRKVIDSTSELANKQTAVLQDAVSEAVETMQSFAQGKVSTDAVSKQAELSMRAIENVLAHFKTLTGSVMNTSAAPKKDDSRD